jgi:hypothetical protein
MPLLAAIKNTTRALPKKRPFILNQHAQKNKKVSFVVRLKLQN